MPKCLFCHRSFKVKSKFHPNQKYCSRKCIKERWRFDNIPPQGQQQKTCLLCSLSFTTSPFHPFQETCSRKCSKRFDLLRNRDRYTASAKAWRLKNPDKLREYYRKSYWNTHDAILARKRLRTLGRISKVEFHTLCEKMKFTCQLCFQIFPFEKLTMDHIVRIREGGTNLIDNIQPACLPCNRLKG